jgi:diguanylate cyclase (GGDEF)-like protein/PAS domain S-box-containing protein/putative nucleotidyltransferase with HDIG domain
VPQKPSVSSSSPELARCCPTCNHAAASAEHEHSRLSAIVEASGDAILSKTLDGIITTWNAAAERIFGYTAEEIIGKPMTILFTADRLQEEVVILDRLQRGIRTDHFDTIRLHRDGTPIHVSVTISPIKDAHGCVIGASTIARDITQRKRIADALQQSEARFRFFGNHAPVLLWLRDAEGGCADVNQAWLDYTGRSMEHELGKGWLENLHSDDVMAEADAFMTAFREHKAYRSEYRLRNDDGEYRWHLDTGIPYYTPEGTFKGYIDSVVDIHERKQAEAKVRLLSTVATESPSGIVVTDPLERIVYVNPAFERLSGYTLSELSGRRAGELLHGPDTDDATRRRAREAIDAAEPVCVEILNYRKCGTPYWVEMHIAPVRDGTGSVTHFVAIERDITEQRSMNEQLKQNLAVIARQNATLESQQVTLLETNAQLETAVVRLERLATTDGLTGLKNHGAFQDRFKEECDRAVRYHSPLSVVLLDVDRFKEFNDTYGHPAGDVVLKQIADILQREARSIDIVARYGGEEFVLILPQTDTEEARQMAERLRQAVASASWELDRITASFGVATSSTLLPNATAMLGEADKAMYRSKYRGRNCVTHVTDALEEETLDTRTLESFNELVQTVSAGRWEMLLTASAQMKEMVIQSYNATIASWSRILDLRDKETDGHSNRVTAMMVRLMRKLGMNEEEAMFARWGALLHDIGKMAVPDRILRKPGPLTDEEWVIMRQHTTLAYEMLSTVKFLGSAIDIPYCHHEKWDGSGYPRGLKGDEIPLMARLFSVIDVYDALTSDRPYRKAWSEDTALTYLRKQAGTHFDPRAVDAFLTVLEAERPVLNAA